MGSTVCPRCGYRDSFLPDYLNNTCVCQVCDSQLDWREIPGCGPDCKPADESGDSKTPDDGSGAGSGERSGTEPE